MSAAGGGRPPPSSRAQEPFQGHLRPRDPHVAAANSHSPAGRRHSCGRGRRSAPPRRPRGAENKRGSATSQRHTPAAAEQRTARTLLSAGKTERQPRWAAAGLVGLPTTGTRARALACRWSVAPAVTRARRTPPHAKRAYPPRAFGFRPSPGGRSGTGPLGRLEPQLVSQSLGVAGRVRVAPHSRPLADQGGSREQAAGPATERKPRPSVAEFRFDRRVISGPASRRTDACSVPHAEQGSPRRCPDAPAQGNAGAHEATGIDASALLTVAALRLTTVCRWVR